MRASLHIESTLELTGEGVSLENVVCDLVWQLVELDGGGTPTTERGRARLASVSARWAVALEDVARAVRDRAGQRLEGAA